jgi:hypothetical protein
MSQIGIAYCILWVFASIRLSNVLDITSRKRYVHLLELRFSEIYLKTNLRDASSLHKPFTD